MEQFIEVTNLDGDKLVVNISHIIRIEPQRDGKTLITLIDPKALYVQESYQEIKALLFISTQENQAWKNINKIH